MMGMVRLMVAEAGFFVVLSMSAGKIIGSPLSGVSTTLIGTIEPKFLAWTTTDWFGLVPLGRSKL